MNSTLNNSAMLGAGAFFVVVFLAFGLLFQPDSLNELGEEDRIVVQCIDAIAAADSAFWDPDTRLPTDRSIDAVELTLLRGIPFAYVMFSSRHGGLDSPTALCWYDRETQNVTRIAYDGGTGGNNGIVLHERDAYFIKLPLEDKRAAHESATIKDINLADVVPGD